MHDRTLFSTIVITAKKDDTVKLAIDKNPEKDQIHNNQCQMPNLLSNLFHRRKGDAEFTSFDLKNVFIQYQLSDEVKSHCKLKIICSEYTGSYSFKTGFYGLTDMSNYFQKAMDNTLKRLPGVFCFLDDNLLSFQRFSLWA